MLMTLKGRVCRAAFVALEMEMAMAMAMDL